MTEFKLISARIPIELKKKAEYYKLNISAILRKALEEEIMKKEKEEFEHSLKQIQTRLKNKEISDVVKLIREDRDTR